MENTNSTLSFDQLPGAVGELLGKVNYLISRIDSQKDDTHKQSMSDDSHVLMDLNEASAFIGKKRSTLYALTSERKIPFCKRGNKLYFFKDQLLKWIEDGGTYDKPYELSAVEQEDFDVHLKMLQNSKKHKPTATLLTNR